MREIKVRAWWKDTMEPIPDFMEEYSIDVLNNDPDNPFIWVLYTGLKDKNGVEIYEGDIIREGGRICPIRYSKQYARFEYTTPTGRAGLYGFYGEVIGNIYENPELIE